jgi:hypothetical protein
MGYSHVIPMTACLPFYLVISAIGNTLVFVNNIVAVVFGFVSNIVASVFYFMIVCVFGTREDDNGGASGFGVLKLVAPSADDLQKKEYQDRVNASEMEKGGTVNL